MAPSSPARPFSYPCYVINLDRQPERLATFRQWNDGCGLAIERFPAIDGAGLDEAARRKLTTVDGLGPGILGNAASHKALWEQTVDRMRPHVIFEDDAVLRSDIAEALPATIAKIGGFWDILLLGFNTDAGLHLRPGEHLRASIEFEYYPSEASLRAHRDARDEVRPYRLANAFGACGYAISPLGARKLLQQCFPIIRRPLLIRGRQPMMVMTIDGPMNIAYPTIDAHICLPPLVMTPNDHATSSTVNGADGRDRPQEARRQRPPRLTADRKPR